MLTPPPSARTLLKAHRLFFIASTDTVTKTIGKTCAKKGSGPMQSICGTIMEEIPAGPYSRHRKDPELELERTRSVSIEWLAWRAREEGIRIVTETMVRRKGRDYSLSP